MAKLDNLSVLIVTWNGDSLLKSCLDSVFSVYGEGIEIVVVDNANLESTRKIVLGFKSVKYVASVTNLGFAGGNNLGLPACSGKYILLLNNDTIIRGDSFTPLVEYMESNQKVAVVQGKMRLSLAGNVLDECGTMFTPMGILYDRYSMLDDATAGPSGPVHSVKGAMMMIRRDVIPLAGGLFHDHFHCNYEDKDFCHRVWMAGYEVHYVDTPAIDHLQSQTIGRLDQVELTGKTLANQLFSYVTTLEKRNAFCFAMKQLLLWSLIAAHGLLIKRQKRAFRIFSCMLSSFWLHRQHVRSSRRILQDLRVKTDKEIFSMTMARPPVSYYYHWLHGDLMDLGRKNGR